MRASRGKGMARLSCLMLVSLMLVACSVSYGLNGASIDYTKTKTIQIADFPIRSLMKGDTEEAVAAGAHAMFMVHGLGHMMGMDVHDMESLDQINVGFDDEVRPNLEQFGTNCLRMGRRLQEGFVVTDEPGIYFIPALIDDWKASGHCKEFINFDKLETYKDFGGIRIEDDLLITKDGCRFIGKDRIPYHPKDVEEFLAASRE